MCYYYYPSAALDMKYLDKEKFGLTETSGIDRKKFE